MSDMPEVIWAKLDEDLKGTKFGPWSVPVDGYYGIDTGTRYTRQDIVDDLTKQLENATKTCDHQQGSILNLLRQVENLKYNQASSVPVDDIAQLIHDVLNQEFVSQHPSDVMGRELLRQALNAFPAPSEHRWDQAGERCVKCGAKDWMGGPCNASPAPMQNTMKILEVYGYSDGAEWMRKVDAKACIDGGFTHAICDGSFVDIFISGDQVGFGELLGEVVVSRPDESGSPVCEPTNPQLLATISEQRLATINGQQIVIDDLTKQLSSANERVRHYITKSDDLTKQLSDLHEQIINARNVLTDYAAHNPVLERVLVEARMKMKPIPALPPQEKSDG